MPQPDRAPATVSMALDALDRDLWETLETENGNPIDDEAWHRYRRFVLTVFGLEPDEA